MGRDRRVGRQWPKCGVVLAAASTLVQLCIPGSGSGIRTFRRRHVLTGSVVAAPDSNRLSRLLWEILNFMADDRTFVPDSDHGQAGWVTLPSGQRAYRYVGSDDLIYDAGTAPGTAASN
ncbi:hypothetical protein O4160_15325 [Rhodococcus sp. IEGM 1401]|uniref:hypothetical protein n=3 Tax=Rhodococcus TaxID=1827 RepID=UPI0022C474FE|nr:hypothetical protein [Rhodococcus sp. IEGM 1414]MCZ4562212.1 hypothetical protein [Rhodococcus sp. IEGM 1401]MDV8035262.1 hypothetical protein [Rhodococcus sp. IEGM 1414]